MKLSFLSKLIFDNLRAMNKSSRRVVSSLMMKIQDQYLHFWPEEMQRAF